MTTTIGQCGKDGCNPVFQTRGEMKPEDHHMQLNRLEAGKAFTEEHGVSLPLKTWADDVNLVENLGPEHSTDIRVSCSKCGKATGWDRRDAEEFRRHADGDYRRYTTVRDGNVENVKTRWNEMVK